MYSKSAKISYATEQDYQSIQLKRIKFQGSTSVTFEADDKLKDQEVCLMVNGKDSALINYENTMTNNELYIFLISKLTNNAVIKLLGSSILELKDQTNEYITSICEVLLFESKATFPTISILPLRREVSKNWGEEQLLTFFIKALQLLEELYKLKSDTNLILHIEHIFYNPGSKEFNFWLKPELHFADEPTRRSILQRKYKSVFDRIHMDDHWHEQLLNVLSLVEITLKLMLLDADFEFSTLDEFVNAIGKCMSSFPELGMILQMTMDDIANIPDEKNPLHLESIFQALQGVVHNNQTESSGDDSALRGKYAATIDQSLQHYHIARCYDSLNLRQLAVLKYTEALKAFGDSTDSESCITLSINLANLYLKLRQPGEAVKILSELLGGASKTNVEQNLKPKYDKVRIFMAVALRIQSKYEEAEGVLNDLLVNSHDLNDIDLSTAVYNLFLIAKLGRGQSNYEDLLGRINNFKPGESFTETFFKMIRHLIAAEAQRNVSNDLDASLSHYHDALTEARRLFKGDFHHINTLILINLGKIYKVQGNYTRAFECLTASMEIRQKVYETFHPELLSNMESMGLAQEATGSYKESLTLFRKIIQIKKNIYGEKDPQIGAIYNVIGSLYKNLGQPQLALENFERSLDIFETAYDQQHQAVATSLNNIGAMYKSMNENEKALEYYNRALDIFKELYGSQHNHVATLMNNIGTLNLYLENYDDAILNYNESLTIYEQNLGDDHPLIASAYLNIATVHDARSNFVNSLECYQKALKIKLKIDDETSEEIGGIYNSLGTVYKGLGRYDEALEAFKRSYQIRQSLHESEDDNSVVISLNNIANLLYTMGEYKRALKYYEDSLELQTRLSGKGSAEVASTLSNTGAVYKNIGELDKAIEYYEKSIEVFKNKHGEEHPTVAACLNNVATVLKMQGKPLEAIEKYNRAKELFEVVYSKSHSTVAMLLNNIGMVHETIGEDTKALQSYNQAMKIYTELYGARHVHVASLNYSIGLLSFKQHDSDMALEYFNKALDIRVTIHTEADPDVAKTLFQIGECLRARNDLTEAEKRLRHALRVYSEISEDPKTDENIGFCYLSLGLLSETQTNVVQARELIERAMKIFTQHSGPDSYHVAECYHGLGNACRTSREFEEAISHYERAEGILDKLDLWEDLLKAQISNDKGILYQSLNDFTKALQCHRICLDIRRKSFKSMSFDLICSYNNVGFAYSQVGDSAKALDYFERAQDNITKEFSDHHPYLATILNNMGGVNGQIGKYQAALDNYERALSIKKATYGSDDIEVATTLNNIGGVYIQLGNPVKALESFESALVIRKACLGEAHPAVATTYNNIGVALTKRGKFSKAMDMHSTSLALRKKLYGEEHTLVGISLNNLGNLSQTMGKHDNALEFHTQALSILTKTFSNKDHQAVATLLNNIGADYLKMNKPKDALEHLTRCMTMQKKLFGGQHVDIAVTYNNIGETYNALGESDKGKDNLLRSIALMKQLFRTTDHPNLASNMRNQGALYNNLSDYEKAREILEKSLTMTTNLFGKNSKEAYQVLLSLASVEEKLGSQEKADECYARAVAVTKKTPIL